MLYTTLQLCKENNACADGYKKLKKSLPKDHKKTDKIQLTHIIESNGLYDTLWSLKATTENSDYLAREFAIWCARESLQYWEREYPDDDRVKNCIDIAEKFNNGDCSKSELDTVRDAARDAAWDAAFAARDAARDAAWAAARDAASDAAWAAAMDAMDAARAAAWAARDAARDAAWAAARDAASDAAWAAAMDARDAARAAAWAAAMDARDAAMDAQKVKFLELLESHK